MAAKVNAIGPWVVGLVLALAGYAYGAGQYAERVAMLEKRVDRLETTIVNQLTSLQKEVVDFRAEQRVLHERK